MAEGQISLTTLGRYEILDQIGSGGMGEVYRARDTRLARIVAIKILRPGLVDAPALRIRFEREARAIASLSHPHICSVYDVGLHEAIDYLVMEYLEGETLETKLRSGPVAADLALLWSVQIAEALDRAQRAGVVHRDLKPSNIMITGSGVKLLDFGLARTALPNSEGTLTERGTLLGTLPWMAPEQVEGKETDSRSDLFSFGVVLYQMLTGRPPFQAETQAGLISAILTSEPAPLRPPLLDHIVKRCLAKDPGERWQTARDVMLELEWLGEGGAALQESSPTRAARGRLTWILFGLLTLVTVALFYTLAHNRPADSVMWELTLAAPQKNTITSFAASPDGAYVAFVAENNGTSILWLRKLDALEPVPLPGTENASYPFWAPASNAIGFFAQGKLKKISVAGGPPQILCDAPVGNGGSWSRDDVILFTPGIFAGLYRIPASGGQPAEITKPDGARLENSHRWPFFLPDGKHYIYMIRSGQSGIYLGQLDDLRQSTRLIENSSAAVYAVGPDGRAYLLFSRSDTLMAQVFDLAAGRMVGEAFAVAVGVPADPLRNWGSFSVSTAGRLVYAQLSPISGTRRLAYFDRLGRQHGMDWSTNDYVSFSISPDGQNAALQRAGGGDLAETWILELAHKTARRFAVAGTFPTWSPDGKRIRLVSVRDGVFGLYHKAVNGADESATLLPSKEPKFPLDWSPDGRSVLYQQNSPDTGNHVFLLPLADGGKPVRLLSSTHNEYDAQFSSDGKWIAYASDDSGSLEVYVQVFQGVLPVTGVRWQISQHGGGKPKWRHDGSELFFLAPDGELTAAATRNDSSILQPGAPERLFSTRLNVIEPGQQYTPAPDGKGFIMLKLTAGPSQPLVVVSNWSKTKP